uniref:C2H2-type domain-containing protein n=1 Tax=Acanthochromis polyacanthus TaxID=80966 RepID=A0A3Q1FMQ9_9TELE
LVTLHFTLSSSRTTQGDTSVILQLHLRVSSLWEGLMTLTGTQPSPHNCVNVHPTITVRGTVRDSLGSTITQKPRHQSNSSHSNDVDNDPLTARQCDNDKARKSATCEICAKAFSNKSVLIKHHRTHTGEKPYACETCGKGFSRRTHLTAHMRRHTGEKPFLCGTCEKSFSRRDYLTDHMRCHTGEKPYVCNTCGKRFSVSSVHRRHMAVHKMGKPYSCGTCGKSFILSPCSVFMCHLRVQCNQFSAHRELLHWFYFMAFKDNLGVHVPITWHARC